MLKAEDFIRNEKLPTRWCAGCGYGQVVRSISMAFEKAGFDRENTVIVSGIGCWGQADSYMTVNALHSTHGRALAYATGVKLANPKLNVVVVMGDGDGATIGGNHFIQACRRNVDLTVIICNNFNYGMTGGQYSGTTPETSITPTSVYGHIEQGFDICKLAEGAGAHYIQRTLGESIVPTANAIAEGISRKGFSLIEVLSPCTVHFGRNRNLRRASELAKWIKDHTIPAAQAAKLTEEEIGDRLVIGKFVDKPGKDYGTKYDELIRVKALEAANKK